jgi:hypothetical protein
MVKFMKKIMFWALLAALPAALYGQSKPGAAFAAYAPVETTVVTVEDAHTGLLLWHDFSQDAKFAGLRSQFDALSAKLLAAPEAELRQWALLGADARLGDIAAAPEMRPRYALLNERLLPGVWFWRLAAIAPDGAQTPIVVAVRQTGKTYALAPLTESLRSHALGALALRLDAKPFRVLTALFPNYSAERDAQFSGCRLPARSNVVDVVCLAEALGGLSAEELRVLNAELEGVEE